MWRVLVKGGCSIVLIGLLLWHQDLSALTSRMAGIDLKGLLAATGLCAALMVVLSLRWSVILAVLGSPRGLRVTLPLIFIGLFFSQLLPAGIGGDVARMWLGRNNGLRLSVAVSSVMVDRLTGLLALLILVTTGLPALFYAMPYRSVINGTVLVLAAGYFGFGIALLLDRVPSALDRFRMIRGLRQIAIDTRAILLRPWAATQVLAYGFVNQVGNAFMIYLLAKGLALPVSVAACLFVVPLANLLQTLPLSIAGWGVRESFFVVGFGLFGMVPQDALALSLFFGFVVLIVSLPGGMLWLIHKREANWQALVPLREPVDVSINAK